MSALVANSRLCTTIDHYPMGDGDVVVRWSGDPSEPDPPGYVIEANVGGAIMLTGGYGYDFRRAVEAGRRVYARLNHSHTDTPALRMEP